LWYSFYFEGRRYRESTKQKTRSAAAQVEAAKLLELQEHGPDFLHQRKCPTLKEFSVRFLEWVDTTRELRSNGRKYYLYGWRLLQFSDLTMMPLNRITRDHAACTTFKRPVAVNRKTKETKMVSCSGHYTNQALRTLKRMQSKALEWKVLRSIPKIALAEAEGRQKTIDERTEGKILDAYAEPSNHPRTRRLREQAWLIIVIMQDSGMRPDEVFPMRIEDIQWEKPSIWIPRGKTKKARRFVPMSNRMEELLRTWCGNRTEGWVFPSARSKSGHLTTIAKGFQAVRDRAGLDKKVVPYLARHTYGTYTMAETKNTFAVADSMGHVDLKSMQPYQHQELEPLRDAINQRNRSRRHQFQLHPAVSELGHNLGHTGTPAD
jgi:integrase